ncbi:MAG: NarK/NasA family nitrate transporter [Bacteroidetes bacterium]|nr:NarK/NasA family nitrate transporter [Bacteroidota bacterium]
MDAKATTISHRILLLNTLAFTVCFAAWMINGVLVTFLVNNGAFKWSSVQVGWLLGVPVLVGALLRLPVGMLTDRFGGKWVMSAILIISAIPMFLLSQANSYSSFLIYSFGFGIAGSSFAAGVAYTALWYPKEKQGTVLGIFGAGNMGASLTTLFAPSILKYVTHSGARLEAWRALPQWYAIVLIAIAIIFFLGTTNKKPPEVKSMVQRLAPLKERRVWRFGLYYYFVFGSIVALAQWLIPYYVNVYSLSIVSAGFMVTAFSFPAGVIRIIGGWLSDKFGARMVLLWVFGDCILLLIFLLVPRMEIQAPGQGIMAAKSGTVTLASDSLIIVDDARYMVQQKKSGEAHTMIRFGIHNNEEGFLLFPNASAWQETMVKTGDVVAKGQLLAKGVTHIYFQANKWIFFTLVLLIAIMMGLGTAAVFKYISDYYPTNIGTVGGIVGVIGGLGGFINPILFGYLLNATGVWTTCWLFLVVVAAVCLILQRLAVAAIKKASVKN